MLAHVFIIVAASAVITTGFAVLLTQMRKGNEVSVTTEWTVICRPTSDDGIAGLLVLLTHGEQHEHEVARVAYDRSKAKDPEVAFDVKLQQWLETARSAAAKMNELDNEYELLATKATREASKRIREILGPKPRATTKPE